MKYVSMSDPSLQFGPLQPSRTSIVVAALRAFGAREPDPSVRNPDWIANRLITSEDLDLIAAHPISTAMRGEYDAGRRNREVAGMSNLMLVRTRFIDDQLQRALESNVTQVVILGAGFDTRAYRFAELLKGMQVFEVDYRSTQELKRRRLTSALETIPPYVHFAEIDFKRDRLPDVLARAGYRSGEKTFFIWEGVSMYLSEQVVRDTLRSISSISARGSSLVMDFAGAAMIELLRKLPDLSQHNYTTKWGEPWTFGVPDQDEAQFFRDCGFEAREVLSVFSRESLKRYVTRADGTSFGSIRGGSPQRNAFVTTLRAIWMFLTRRSRWYAVATLEVA
jgi:methyltransferase (TIGR00027 family)